MSNNKKAQTMNTGILAGLIGVVVILVIITMTLAFGAQINADIRDDFTEGTTAFNISSDSLTALNTLSEKQNTWALIIGVGIVIALLLGFLGFVAFRR